MEINIKGSEKEIADLVLGIQDRQMERIGIDKESLRKMSIASADGFQAGLEAIRDMP